MKKLHLALVALILAAGPATVPAAAPAMPAASKAASTGGNSPHETTSTPALGRGGPRVTVTYGRPFSKAPNSTEIRKIWGALVPWEKAWRLGSDEATLFLTPVPLVFGETTIPAGAYTLYMVPSEKGVSKLAFSSNIGKWGIPVDETKDVARVDLKKDMVEKQVDQLTIALTADPAPATSGVLKIIWETTQFSVAFAVKK